ncbi:MAG: hypothetical protein AAGC68_13455 [Verrucomicrobiota bacterium]
MGRRHCLWFVVVLFSFSTGSFASDVASRLRSLVIPDIELVDVPLVDAVQFIQAKSEELDPSGRGVNVILNSAEAGEKTVTLKVRNMTLGRTLWFLGAMTGCVVEVDAHAAMLRPVLGRFPLPESQSDPRVLAKVSRIIVPSLEFQDTPLEDALDFLRDFSMQLDVAEPDPAQRGVNIIRFPEDVPRGVGANPRGKPEGVDFGAAPAPLETANGPAITLKLSNVPLADAIRYTSELASHEVRLIKGAIVLLPEP